MRAIVLSLAKEHAEHFLMLTCISKINGKDMLNCFIYIYVTLSHLRSKEITGIHKPCIPHSNDSSATTEYKPVCIQM